MAEYLRMLREQFDRLSTVQKWSVGALSAVVFAVLAFLVLAPRGETMERLFTGMEPREAAKVKARLDQLGVKYRLEDEGRSVAVPAERKAEVRLALAADDSLPQSSRGWFELLGTPTPINNSKELFDVNYLQGLQGEIERTIRSFPDVKDVRVHIVKPKAAMFSEEQRPDQASVTLDFHPAVRIDPNKIKAIRNLVAFSTGVPLEEIRIIDAAESRDLTDLIADDRSGAGLTASQLDVQKKLAKERESDLQRKLDGFIGASRSRVSVALELGFDEVEEDRTVLKPPVEGEEAGVAVSRKTVAENYEGLSPVNGGEPGVNPNVPPTYPGAKKGQTKYTKSDVEENLDYNVEKTRTKKAVGSTVKRMTVGAMIDVSVPDSDMAGLRNFIASAVGLDERRGDRLTVDRMKFNVDDRKAAEARLRRERLQEMFAKIAIVALPVFLLLLIFVLLWRRWEAKVEELEPDVLDLTEIGETERVEEKDELTPEQRERQDKVSRVRSIATNDPDGIAKLLQLWLVED